MDAIFNGNAENNTDTITSDRIFLREINLPALELKKKNYVEQIIQNFG